MTKTINAFSKCAIAAAVLSLGLAGTALAQTANSTGPAGSSNAGVKTPSTGGNEVSPRSGPLPGKSTTAVMPDDKPKTTGEAGDARPSEKGSRITRDSASTPNPKSPKDVKEAGDARPLERQGGTTGTTGKGTSSDSSKRY
ncbi:MAG TPA: hypothetical protein VNT02_11890 [Burkholderiales bacterium]|nr:hypothetical protein [Burkholderiales bacterium]